jgi:hypothetical protein
MIIERICFELPKALRPVKPDWGPYVVFYWDPNEGWQICKEFSTAEAARRYVERHYRTEYPYADILIVRIIEQWDIG